MPVHGLGDQRAILRLSGDYVLRWGELASELFAGDHLAALVLNTVLRLNVHHVFEDPVLNLRYGGMEPPPDDQRRPVSISEAARAMAMPRATAGRYVAGLLDRGSFIARGRVGVIVPVRELVHDEARTMTDANYLNILQMMRRLGERGLLGTGASKTDIHGAEALRSRTDRYRLVLRAAGEFVSDWMIPWNSHYQTSYLYGLVFTAILQANDRATDEAADQLADVGKHPISAHATAQSLQLPPETVRRHILRLETDGLIARGASGLIVPSSAWDTQAGRDVLDGAAKAVARLDAIFAAYQVELHA